MNECSLTHIGGLRNTTFMVLHKIHRGTTNQAKDPLSLALLILLMASKIINKCKGEKGLNLTKTVQTLKRKILRTIYHDFEPFIMVERNVDETHPNS